MVSVRGKLELGDFKKALPTMGERIPADEVELLFGMADEVLCCQMQPPYNLLVWLAGWFGQYHLLRICYAAPCDVITQY